MTKHILILGNDSDHDAAYLKGRLEHVGASVDYWDTQLFPQQLQLTWNPHTHRGYVKLPTGKIINLGNIHSIFWCTLSAVDVPMSPDLHQYQMAVADSTSVLRSLIRSCAAHWVNSWEAYQFHREKPLQLSAVKELGVMIPKTLISNNPQHIQTFAATIPRLIFKPVYQGAYTRLLDESQLDQTQLDHVLRVSPITLQEYVPGTNIRCYVIGQQVYAAEIKSSYIDFREDAQARFIPAILPKAVHENCLKIAQALFLEWTAIDWRLSPQGEFIFLTADPSPTFTHFEQCTGFPLTESLIHLLMS